MKERSRVEEEENEGRKGMMGDRKGEGDEGLRK